jgi:hypothetical protein
VVFLIYTGGQAIHQAKPNSLFSRFLLQVYIIMSSMDEHILKTTKEIVVKFIETGRISPSGFSESFKSIYHTIDETVKESTDKTRKEELQHDD